MRKLAITNTNHVYQPIKIQFVSRNIPIENLVGNATYILDFIRYLRQAGCEIEFLVLDSSPNGRIPWYVISPTLARIAHVSVKDNLRVGRVLLRFKSLSNWIIELLRLAYDRLPEILKNIYRSARDKRQQMPTWYMVDSQIWDVLVTPEEVNFASSRFVKFKPDVVIANYVFLANILDSPYLDETVLKVILTHDVRHQRTAHFNKLGVTSFESNWNRETEAIELCKAHVLLAIQQEDAQVFQEMTPKSKVICMPISAVYHPHIAKQVSGRCLFVGSYTDHNLHGLKWFLKNVWPIVLQSVPHSSLHVCGTVCYGIEETFPNVSFLGKVEDLQPEYSNAEVCLVPLPIGSGLKIKLVEALSHSRACVSTSVGVQGLREIVGNAVFVADSPEDFAAAIHTILTNPNKRQWMQEQARNYVTEKLSPKAVYQPFLDYVHDYLQGVPNKP
jgi:Glycosyl transferases group 1